jgi:hypothetical protein
MLEIVRKLIKNQTVPLVHLEGNDKVSKVQWVGAVQKNPNSLLDLFSLVSWELHSNPVEFFISGVSLGWGYIGDIAGPTVDISRSAPAVGPVPAAGEIKTPEGLSIRGTISRALATIPEQKKKLPYCPCVIISGEKRIREIHFEYLDLLEDTVLLDKRKNRRFTIIPDTKIDITMPDGYSGSGWICDESGQTVTINRSIKIMGLLRDKKGVPVLKDGNPIEIEVGINWSGRLGQRATNDKMTALWSSAISGREKLIFGVLAFIFGNLIGVVAHI